MPRRAFLQFGKPLPGQPSPACIIRFLSKVRVGQLPPEAEALGIESPCWHWTARCDDNGYGEFKWRGEKRIAHRFAWTALRGSIPDGSDIDHLCFVHDCVNPDHLDPKSRSENSSRRPSRERERERDGVGIGVGV